MLDTKTYRAKYKSKFKTENVRQLLEFHGSDHHTVPLKFEETGFKEGGRSDLASDWHRICFHVCILQSIQIAG